MNSAVPNLAEGSEKTLEYRSEKNERICTQELKKHNSNNKGINMRSIIVLVLIMFLGGYYLHLENFEKINTANINHNYYSQTSDHNLFARVRANSAAINNTYNMDLPASYVYKTKSTNYYNQVVYNVNNYFYMTEFGINEPYIEYRYVTYKKFTLPLREVKSTPGFFPVTFNKSLLSQTDPYHLLLL